MSKIKGTAMWCSLAKTNEMSGKYQLDVCNLDTAARKQLKAEGIKVKQEETRDDDREPRGYFITVKGNPDYPPKVVDAQKKPLDPKKVGIGNGSLVNVSYKPYEWNFKGKTGISPGLRAVQVLKLESYSDGVDEFDEEEGFTAEEDTPFDTDDDDLDEVADDDLDTENL